MKPNKIYSLLGIAMRGRNVVSGEFATESAVKDGSAMLVLVAKDASEETRKRYRQLAAKAKIELFYLGDRELLGHCIGKDFRAVAAVLDAGFANAIAKHCRSDSDTGVD